MAYAKIRPRRGTASEWIKANPVLLEGEIGIEVPSTGIGTGLVRMKFGDGVTPWNSLPYGATESDLITAYGNSIHVDKAKNAPAFLDIYGVSTQDGTPTPDSPVAIESTVVSEIRVCKKNLFKCTSFANGTQNGVTLEGYLNEQGFLEYFTLNGTCTNAIYRSLTYPNMTLPKGSYVLSGCPSGGSNTSYRWYISTTDGKTYMDEGKGVSFTFEDTTTFSLTLVIYNGAICNNVKFYPMISVEGGAYEPYTEQVFNVPCVELNGLNGVSDYIDARRGVLVQKFKEVVLGATGWARASDGTFRMYLSDYKYRDNVTVNHKVNQLNAISIKDYTSNNAPNNSAIITDTSTLLCKASAFTTIDEWNTHLSSNPMTVVYELAEPIETPLSEETLQALNDIVLYEGVNNITTDSTGEIKLVYATNENSVITLENYKNIVKILEMLGGLSFVPISESEYEALSDPDDHTVFIAYEDETE